MTGSRAHRPHGPGNMTAIDANWGAAQVRTILPRIDDTNRRILTKKFELGLFERPMADRA